MFFKNGRRLGSLTRNEVPISSGARCTEIGRAPGSILTVEHFLAAVLGLRLDNVEARVDGPELPALDGSAVGFVTFLKKLGITTQKKPRNVWRVREPIFCFDGEGRAIQALPSQSLSVSYVMDYAHPALRNQIISFKVTSSSFEKEIAPARTFCTQEEAQALQKRGFGRGANLSNTLVMAASGPVRNRLRFPDECARHKALDLLGDLALLGAAVEGDFRGIRSGHGLNRLLVEALRRQNEKR